VAASAAEATSGECSFPVRVSTILVFLTVIWLWLFNEIGFVIYNLGSKFHPGMLHSTCTKGVTTLCWVIPCPLCPLPLFFLGL
jgi:hypothetical protein